MKYLPLLLISLSTMATIVMVVGQMDALLMAWVIFPYLFCLAIAADQARKGNKPGIAAGVGALVCLLPVLPYYEAYTYDGTDGQVALVYAVVPAYQVIGFALISGVASLIARRKLKKS